MKIAGVGTTGLIGSRFKFLLNKYDIYGLSASEGIDIRKKDTLFKNLDKINPDLIINFAAKTNVDACEQDRKKDVEKLNKLEIIDDDQIIVDKIISEDFENDDSAFAINSSGAKNLTEYAKRTGAKLVYLSTDFVFQGDKDYYDEEDDPNPIDWYGMTKYFGEQIIKKELTNFMIVRTAFPYGFRNEKKTDFVWKLYDLIKQEKDISLVEDQIITPTFIDDIVYGLEFLINNDKNGIFNLVGKDFLSPYEIGKLISKILLGVERDFKKTKREELYKGKAARPFKVRMKNDKLEKLGFETRTFEEGLETIKKRL